MKNFLLSIRATILIAKEQSARQKMYNQQIKLTDFYNKHKDDEYDLKELINSQVWFIREKFNQK